MRTDRLETGQRTHIHVRFVYMGNSIWIGDFFQSDKCD